MKIGGLPTEDPVKGRRIVGFLIIAAMVILLVVIMILVIKPTPQIAYSCAVDPALGPQPVDLCSLVPANIRERNNVMVTQGLANRPTVMRIKDIDILYVNVLTPEQQVSTLVSTSGIARYFNERGTLQGMGIGAALVIFLLVAFYVVKRILRERKRYLGRLERQEKIQQRKSPVENELDFETVRI